MLGYLCNKSSVHALTCPVSLEELNLSSSLVRTFPGALTDLYVGRTDEITFMCRLDLFYYPFDVQVVARDICGVF